MTIPSQWKTRHAFSDSRSSTCLLRFKVACVVLTSGKRQYFVYSGHALCQDQILPRNCFLRESGPLEPNGPSVELPGLRACARLGCYVPISATAFRAFLGWCRLREGTSARGTNRTTGNKQPGRFCLLPPLRPGPLFLTQRGPEVHLSPGTGTKHFHNGAGPSGIAVAIRPG